MSTGTIQVITTTGGSAPVSGVLITIRNPEDNFIQIAQYQTDTEGYSEPVTVETPPKELSLDENNTIRPYSVYNVSATATGYQPVSVEGVQCFEGENALLELQLIPTEENTGERASEQAFDIPGHSLYTGIDSGSGSPPVEQCVPFVLRQVIIPEKVTVHLGKPAASATNVTVSFKNYIKNVASSEIYPTWPTESLKANIYAQISLTLNRVYTEWYKSKGYNFTITNSTSYDQAYVHNRNIFESISKIVDDIFNTYIRKQGTVNPYYAEYCDGKSVTCPGLKQWGTVSYAQQGLSALNILRKYYTNIELVTTNNIQAIKDSYPGTPLRIGSTGVNVRIIQRQLNRIARDYPFFGTNEVDGVYGASTAETVRKFQKQFKLTVDGVVGKSTWYKISYIYVSVTDLAELTSEGEKPNGDNQTAVEGTFPGTLRRGSTGSDVERLQFYLHAVAPYTTEIQTVAQDAIFGPATESAVMAYQSLSGLASDGVVGPATWDSLYKAYAAIQKDVNTSQDFPGAYPGQSFQQGSRGNYVKTIQFWLNIVGDFYSGIPKLTTDGIFGPATTAAVTAFQQRFALTPDGIVGRNTWNKLNEIYIDVIANLLPAGGNPGTYPGAPLSLGSRGHSVKEMQFYLYIMSAYYSTIPKIAYDGVFGNDTREAVRAFQRLYGLTDDGIVGPVTWSKIYQVFLQLRNVDGPVYSTRQTAYPGHELSQGDDGSVVGWVQYMLNFISEYYNTITPVEINSVFDDDTRLSVEDFQREFFLPITGTVNEATFNAMVQIYYSVLALYQYNNGTLPDGSYPGFALTLGSAGPAVWQLQRYINEIAARFCSSFHVEENGFFDQQLLDAIKSFQDDFNLPVTGVVDKETWDTIFEFYNM